MVQSGVSLCLQKLSMRLLIFPSWRWVNDRRRRIVIIGSTLISLILALFLAVPGVHAESPFNDPAYQRLTCDPKTVNFGCEDPAALAGLQPRRP